MASPFDAAMHDAFGKVHARNVYATYGPDLLPGDVSRYLGPAFRGVRIDRALLPKAQARIPLFHSVGGLDPLEQKDVEKPLGDGLPETLPEWIAYNGLVRIKIKLSGEDLKWDVARTLAIDRVAAAAQARRGVKDWSYASTSTSAARTSRTCSSACGRCAPDLPEGSSGFCTSSSRPRGI